MTSLTSPITGLPRLYKWDDDERTTLAFRHGLSQVNSRWKAEDEKKQIKKLKMVNRIDISSSKHLVAFLLLFLPLLVVSGVLMSASYGSLIIASSTGRNLFLYGLLALSVFCTFSWLYSKSRTPLYFHSTALDRVLVFFANSWILINLQHHEKRWGNDSPGGFSERDQLGLLQHYGFFLGFGYTLTKWIKWKITWTRHLLTDRVLLHLGQDWKSERASGFCFSSFFLFPFDEDMRNAA
jgi:hypothetical protein